MSRNIEIHEFEMVANLKGPGQVSKVTRVKGADKQIAEVGVDDALKKAREVVGALNLKIRSINVTTNGSIRVVVHKPGARRGTSRMGGMVYQRPPRTPGK